MATRAERIGRGDSTGESMEQMGDRVSGTHDESKWALLTTEFWAMVVLIVAIVVATAISDSLNDRRAWLLVTIVGTGYIVSRGLAKAGVDHARLGFRRRG